MPASRPLRSSQVELHRHFDQHVHRHAEPARRGKPPLPHGRCRALVEPVAEAAQHPRRSYGAIRADHHFHQHVAGDVRAAGFFRVDGFDFVQQPRRLHAAARAVRAAAGTAARAVADAVAASRTRSAVTSGAGAAPVARSERSGRRLPRRSRLLSRWRPQRPARRVPSAAWSEWVPAPAWVPGAAQPPAPTASAARGVAVRSSLRAGGRGARSPPPPPPPPGPGSTRNTRRAGVSAIVSAAGAAVRPSAMTAATAVTWMASDHGLGRPCATRRPFGRREERRLSRCGRQEGRVPQDARRRDGLGLRHQPGARQQPQPAPGDERFHRLPAHVGGAGDLVERIDVGRPGGHRRSEGKTLASPARPVFRGNARRGAACLQESRPRERAETQVVRRPSTNFRPSRSPSSRTAPKPA